MKDKFQKLVRNKMVCLKVDCGSRYLRSFLGIHVQFIHNGQLVLFTLSCIELKTRHTGKNLKNAILSEAEKWGITQSQVYSITTDNARNIVKAVQLGDTGSRPAIPGEEWDDCDIDDFDEQNDIDAEAMSNNISSCTWIENFISSK